MPLALRVSFVALLFALPAIARADEPPLPKGAKLRLGTEQFRLDPKQWRASALAPDGKGLIVPLTFSGFEVLDFATGKASKTIRIEELSANAIFQTISVSADGKRILTDQFTGYHVWDLESGKAVFVLKKSGSQRVAMAADGNTVFVRDDTGFTAHALGGEKQKKALGLKIENLETVQPSADGKLLAVIGREKTETLLRLWDVAADKELAVVRETKDTGPPRMIGFAPDGKSFVVSYMKGKAVLYDLTGKAGKTFTFAGEFPWRPTFTPDGKGLVAVLSGNRVEWLNVADGKSKGVTNCPVADAADLFITSIAFTAPDRAVVWAYRERAALAWEVPGGKALTPVEGHFGAARGAAFTPDGKELLTVGRDDRTLRWDTSTGKQLGAVALKPSPQFATRPPIVLSADGRRGFTTEAVYDLTNGKELVAWPETAKLKPGFVAVVPAANGSRCAFVISAREAGKDGRVVVCSAQGKVELDVPLPGADGIGTGAAVSADGSRVVTVVMPPVMKDKPINTVVRAWEVPSAKPEGFVKTGKKVCDVIVPDARGEARALTVSPDGKTAYLTSVRGRAFSFDLETGKLGRTFGDETVSFTQFPLVSADGKLLAVSEITNRKTDGQLVQTRLYDTATGALRHTLDGYNYPAAFAPDGKTFATFNSYTVLLWDLSAPK